MRLKQNLCSVVIILSFLAFSFDNAKALAQEEPVLPDPVPVVEAAPAALPPGVPLLPASLVRIIDTSNAAWNPSAPDPAGVDYWPLTGGLLVADSEVDEMPPYFVGKNVFLSTTSGNLTGTCSTTSFTNEPTGVAINPGNNHIFFSADEPGGRVAEVSLGPDGVYCTADDAVTVTNVAALYNVNDAEDVAYGNNTLFIAGGSAAEVFAIPLGSNGVLGGGDDGAMTHFDTAAWGFRDLEGIGYNAAAGTLFIISSDRADRYLGETTTTGTLLRAYNLSFMGDDYNIRSDVTYAPASQDPGAWNIYIAGRGVDNNINPNENDGKIWEISIVPDAPPTVLSITRADTNPTNLSSVHFTATFSEPVTGVSASDFSAYVTGGISGVTIAAVSGSGNTYTVTANTGLGDGTIRLDVPVSATIKDQAGNALGGLPFQAGEAYSIIKPATYNDVPTSHWAWLFVERLSRAGITSGCGGSNYCPDSSVTRAQMAVFLLRGIHSPSYTPPAIGAGSGFGDVPPDHWAASFIKQLAAEGITVGCGNGNYCPEQPVTRAQMAVFLLRSKYGARYKPPAVGAGTGFGDVPPTYWAAAFIKQLVTEGITAGCGNGNYCPEAPVTRAQMAVLLVRTFSLP